MTTIRSVRQPVATLSGGQRQSVAVARAVMWNNRVVFLDEPTAALGVAQTRQVLELVKRLGQQGLAVEDDLALVDRVDPGDALDQRRLPGAVVADERHHLAGGDVEVDLVERLNRAEALGDSAQLEDRAFTH